MSRIGKKIIDIPTGVTLDKKLNMIVVSGPKGTMEIHFPKGLVLDIKDGKAVVSIPDGNTDRIDNLHGLARTLITNAISGVTKGWEKNVELVGVGYRATGAGMEITLNVGYSHPVKITSPSKDISFTIRENTKITVSGIDKKLVGEVAAKLRSIRPPEPYKGKGIRYEGEKVRRKAGKAVKAAGAA